MMGWRVLRGQVVVREELDAAHAHYRHIVTLREREGTDEDAERAARKFHIGRVLAMGPPATTSRGVEVPHGFAVGDRVVFVWTHLEKAWTRNWLDDEPAAWLPQQNVMAVLES